MFTKTACCLLVSGIILAGCGGGSSDNSAKQNTGSPSNVVVNGPEKTVNAGSTETVSVTDKSQTIDKTQTADTTPSASFDIAAEYKVNTPVNLDASKSFDPSGSQITYHWSIDSKPDSSNSTINTPDDVKATLTPDVPGTYSIVLTVQGGATSTRITHTFEAKKDNVAPIANAGDKQQVTAGTTITLNGSKSYDPDGTSIQYQWSLTAKPEGSSVALSDEHIANPSLTVDQVGHYVFSLVVNDGQVDSPAAQVAVDVVKGNTAPVANAGSAQSVVVGDAVTLNGSASNDMDGDKLTYAWSFVSQPEGSTARFNVAESINPSFTPDVAGNYVAALKVFDGHAYSDVATVTIAASTRNAKPVAVVGKDQSLNTNTRVSLDGSASSDADGDKLTYKWSMLSKPVISNTNLSDTSVATPSFTADAAGTYVLQLVVNDGKDDSDPVKMSVNVVAGVNPIPSGAGLIVNASSSFFVINENTKSTSLNSYSSACPLFYATDTTPDGKLVGLASSKAGIFEIDPYQSLCLRKSTAEIQGDNYNSGIAIDGQGSVFLSDSSSVKQVDYSGTILSSQQYSGYVPGVRGIDFSTDGQLYGLSFYHGLELVKVDPVTGITTFVAKLNTDGDASVYSFYDIDIDNDNILRVFNVDNKLMYVWDLSGKLIRTEKYDQFKGSYGFLPVSYVGGEPDTTTSGAVSSSSVSLSSSGSSSASVVVSSYGSSSSSVVESSSVTSSSTGDSAGITITRSLSASSAQ